jgi:hypothetical protein
MRCAKFIKTIEGLFITCYLQRLNCSLTGGLRQPQGFEIRVSHRLKGPPHQSCLSLPADRARADPHPPLAGRKRMMLEGSTGGCGYDMQRPGMPGCQAGSNKNGHDADGC